MQRNHMDPIDTQVARHDPAEDWNRPRDMGWLGRSPVAIVTHGCPTASDDHLIALQSWVARLVGVLTGLHLPRFRPPSWQQIAGSMRSLF
ncbi:MAG: hypothetical protein R3D05_06250 [Dongiaceae bacterium]